MRVVEIVTILDAFLRLTVLPSLFKKIPLWAPFPEVSVALPSLFKKTPPWAPLPEASFALPSLFKKIPFPTLNCSPVFVQKDTTLGAFPCAGPLPSTALLFRIRPSSSSSSSKPLTMSELSCFAFNGQFRAKCSTDLHTLQ